MVDHHLTAEIANGHKKIIEASIRKRGKWTRDGASDPGVAAMELQAWQEYSAIYNREFRANGGNAAAAAQAALNDFKSKFGTDEKTGPYALQQPAPGVDPQRVGKYAEYDPTGVILASILCSRTVRKDQAWCLLRMTSSKINLTCTEERMYN